MPPLLHLFGKLRSTKRQSLVTQYIIFTRHRTFNPKFISIQC